MVKVIMDSGKEYFVDGFDRPIDFIRSLSKSFGEDVEFRPNFFTPIGNNLVRTLAISSVEAVK